MRSFALFSYARTTPVLFISQIHWECTMGEARVDSMRFLFSLRQTSNISSIWSSCHNFARIYALCIFFTAQLIKMYFSLTYNSIFNFKIYNSSYILYEHLSFFWKFFFKVNVRDTKRSASLLSVWIKKTLISYA